ERLGALQPDSTAASTGLGLIALRARDSRVARQYFLQSLANDPNSVSTRQILAAIAEDGDPREGLRLCEGIQRLAPQTASHNDWPDGLQQDHTSRASKPSIPAALLEAGKGD